VAPDRPATAFGMGVDDGYDPATEADRRPGSPARERGRQ